MSKVKDESLAVRGEGELLWARENMPVLAEVRKRFEKEKPLKGVSIGTCLHLEKKTGILLEVLAAGGAVVSACSCNPLTTDDCVAAALAKKMNVFAWAGQSNEDYYECINKVLDAKPQVVIDDGCDQVFAIHKKRVELLKSTIGGCEETTTGVTRLNAMAHDGELKFPVFAVNNAYSKFLFDNRYGTGQSTVDAITHITNKLVAGKTVVVVGYGWCGKGIAARMKGMGANVIVVESGVRLNASQPSGWHKALEALYDGFRVMSLDEAAPLADFIVTVTGGKAIVSRDHFSKLKDGVILANAGHFNVEIDEPGLRSLSKRVEEVKDNVVRYELKDGRKVYLLSEGRLVNLARPGGQGHPIEIMDGSFAVQALCARRMLEEGKKMKPGVYDVPVDIDDEVARLALEVQGVKLKKPSREQLDYLQSWKEGT
ncbi:adenosylhomocysteinase [Candidatus Micrarchaeota archaeon]|nr:adenosylhomocysteinase [Candidatus Micrarchaeota archaeon]